MSDFLFVVLPGLQLNPLAQEEVVALVKKECAGAVPHNQLSHFRVVLRSGQDESSIEPLIPGGATEPLLRAVVRWAGQRTTDIVLRLEGHRGRKPLPDVKHLVGTIADALALRGHRRGAHNFEVILGERSTT